MLRRTTLLAALTLLVPASYALSLGPDEAPAASGVASAAAASAESCAACHAPVVAEWRGSAHARATAATNPLYRLLLGKARAVLGEAAERRCATCHYPPGTGPGTGSPFADEGVTCVVCHELADGHPEQRLRDGRPARLRADDVERYGSQKLCLRCHNVARSPAGHPICTTGPEADEAMSGSCTDCHMKDVPGAATPARAHETHTAHRFPGGRDLAFLRAAVELELRVEKKAGGAVAVVRLTAPEVGHALPTGTPLRHLVLHVEALDAAAQRVWHNAEDPRARLQIVFHDADGKPVPAFAAQTPGKDTRLRPGEERELRYPLPAGTAKVRATLLYHHAPAPILAAAGITGEAAKPLVLATAEARP